MLQHHEVIKIIEEGVSDFINDARKLSDRVNMHVTGKNVEGYLEDLENYENNNQKELREKLLKSNKGVFSFLLRPFDKVFTARGGSISYNLQERQLEKLTSYTSDVSDGLDIKDFLKKKAFKKYIIDPNGFVMVNINPEGELSTQIFSSKDVIWYDKRGNNINSIIFNSFESEDENDTKNYYRVIDEATDSIWVQDGDNIYQDEDSIYPNFFGYVPAYILGDTYDPNSELFLSVVDDLLEDGEERLRDVSVNTVHKLSHGYAKYWQYPEACTRCGGEGALKIKIDDVVTDEVCPSCGGGGVKQRKMPSDLMLIDIPKDDEQKITPDVGGYINPSIEIWNKYNEDILKIRNEMFQTLWGTTYESEGKNETATGKLLDSQPAQDRLGSSSLTFAKIHEFILDCYGQVAFLNTSYKSSVSYGTRYLIETPDEALKRFSEASEKKLPSILQNDLLDKFYQTEYASNNIEYVKIKKIIAVDPFPFSTAKEVQELGIEGVELQMKIFHPQWVNQLDDAKKTLMTIDELKEDLKEYTSKMNINIKSKTNVTS